MREILHKIIDNKTVKPMARTEAMARCLLMGVWSTYAVACLFLR
eukprot:XP_001704100.1 Hypothetical protein GL50803_28203 [Giardia lamblia ATCC 50803]